MARVSPKIHVELDPMIPVPEVVATIVALLPYNQGYEDAILQGVKEAIDRMQQQRTQQQTARKGENQGG